MKLFEFVRRSRRPSSAAAAVATPEPVPSAPAEKKKRRPSSGSAAWKPTLGAISEDAAVAEAEKAKAKAKLAAAAKAREKRPPPRASRPDYDDFRRFGAPAVLPAFGPAAFLF